MRFFFAFIASFCMLSICSKSSFLYPLNDWVDVDCFFTVGRGIIHGLVPYRDLYEQKGPLLYLLFSLAALISESSFIGVFLLETFLFSFFLYISGTIVEKLADCENVYWPSVALLSIIIPITPSFSHGSSAEEFILPILALTLWIVLRAVHSKALLFRKDGFVLGLCAGVAFWTKYTFCGLFLGLGIVVVFWYLFLKQTKKLFPLILFSVLGFLAVSFLVLGWFAAKGALSDLFTVYFIHNLTSYQSKYIIYNTALNTLFIKNLPWTIPVAIGLIWPIFKKRTWESVTLFLAAFFLFLFSYATGWQYPYYALVLSVFAPMGLVFISDIVIALSKRRASLAARVISAILIVSAPFVAYHCSPNTYMLGLPRNQTPQYQFAKIIQQAKNASLLNYGFLDGGFYFASGLLPTERFFCLLNLDLPEMKEEMNVCIVEGRTTFVVTRNSSIPSSNYVLIDEATMMLEGRDWIYSLYQRVE